MPKIFSVCRWCSDPFWALQKNVKRGWGKYCSQDCSKKANADAIRRKAIASGVVYKKMPRGVLSKTYVVGSCLRCGEKILGLQRNTQRRFCSQSCAVKYRHDIQREKRLSDPYLRYDTALGRLTTFRWACEWCADPFWVSMGELPRESCGRFCSPRCAYRSRRRSLDGTVRDRRSGAYMEWSSGVLSRDNYTCQHCYVRGSELHAHHIKGWAEYPSLRFDMDNGITLCVKCHWEEHRRLSKVGKELKV